MIVRGLLIIIITVVIILPHHLALSSPLLYSTRHLLYEQLNGSPSPSPSHGESNLQQYCNRASSTSCQLNNITACLTGSHEETCLFVQNNGENPLHVKIMILPANNTIKEIYLSNHKMKKINISLDVDLSSAIALTTSDGDCVIHAAAPAPENYYQKYPSYSIYITPINCAYIVIILLIIGGILTFFKLRTRGRHLEGVPYHELEMGNSTALNLEDDEKENWDQDWDDAWGDEKPVKYVGDNPVIKVEQTNGLTSKMPDSNGSRKEWND